MFSLEKLWDGMKDEGENSFDPGKCDSGMK